MNSEKHKLVHRLRDARMNAGVSLRAMTARTGLPASTLLRQEEMSDLPLSDFLTWQEALKVPFEELLESHVGRTADHIRVRAGLIRLVKTVKTFYYGALTEPQSCIVQNVVNQLNEIMPELKDIEAWPQHGVRRSPTDPARIETRVVGDLRAIFGDFGDVGDIGDTNLSAAS